MFPLKERIIGGYHFRQPTSYSSSHLGVDYHCSYVPIFAPFDGVSTTSKGTQGGNTISFKPDSLPVMMRFMHLSEMKAGHFKEGEQIGVTGETGTLAGSPHLHLDLATNWSGTYWNNINNFIDPEIFNWTGDSMNGLKLWDNSGQVWAEFDNKQFYVEDPKSIDGLTVVKGEPHGEILIKQKDQDTRLAEQKVEYEIRLKQMTTEADSMAKILKTTNELNGVLLGENQTYFDGLCEHGEACFDLAVEPVSCPKPSLLELIRNIFKGVK